MVGIFDLVRDFRRKEIETGVPETLMVGELLDGQQLDCVNPEIAQIRDSLDHIQETAVSLPPLVPPSSIDGPEHSHVQLINDELMERGWPPLPVVPAVAL